MSVLLEFSMFPTDKGESKSQYVARSMEIIQNSGLNYKVGPMGTTIEGEWDEVMSVVKACYMAMEKDCNRVYTGIKIDARKGSGNRLTGKLESLQKKVDKPLNS